MPLNLDIFVNEAADHIKQKKAKVQITKATQTFTTTSVAVGTNVQFCDLWPAIKVALESLKSFLPFWAGWMADVLIAIGNKACVN